LAEKMPFAQICPLLAATGTARPSNDRNNAIELNRRTMDYQWTANGVTGYLTPVGMFRHSLM
jgi:hypothetical protein